VSKSKLTKVGKIKRPLATEIIGKDLNIIFSNGKKIKDTSESFTLKDLLIYDLLKH